jgi:transposase
MAGARWVPAWVLRPFDGRNARERAVPAWVRPSGLFPNSRPGAGIKPRIPHTGQEKPVTAIRAAGIDAGKSFLDVAVAPEGRAFRVANVSRGIATLIERLVRMDVRRVVLEAIGPYASALVRALAKAGFEIGLVNPRRIKAFRDAEGRRAKTDRLDAELIARFALVMSDAIRPLPSDDQLAAKALAARRRQIVEMIAMEKTRLKQTVDPLIAASHRSAIAIFTGERKRIEEALDRKLDADPLNKRRREILVSIPGIGKQVATVLVTDLPELGTTDRRGIASLAGLAPHPHQSGASPGRNQIAGGRPCVRAALYMAALSAARFDPQLRAAYKAMRHDGKPAKVALIATARKLVTLANTLLKADRFYDPNHGANP